MTSVGERGYRSIGEVLAEVQDEFPDITISKIRFLESQGLIDPERTASGYRKFYDNDVARLRAILRTQREEYLPLKVIRDRLDRDDRADLASEAEAAEVATSSEPPAAARPAPPVDRLAPSRPDLRSVPPAPVTPPSPSQPSAFHPTTRPARVPSPVIVPERLVEECGSLRELAEMVELDEPTLRELESFGLLKATEVGREHFYGADAVAICRAVRPLLALGLEPRHLRMYRTAADREADLYEQAVLPLLKQRNPQARAEARDRLTALASAGTQLHAALVQQLLTRMG
jgi:DNA-binding transcriptional MerR regulator